MRTRHKFEVSPVNAAAEKQPSGDTNPGNGPRLFSRVPTHAIGVLGERRICARAFLRLPLRLTRVGSAAEDIPVTLVTRNISASGIYFLAPKKIEPGTSIEIEVALVERPQGKGTVRMSTAAHVVRAEPADSPGWHGLAATFDSFEFQRDEALPARFRKP